MKILVLTLGLKFVERKIKVKSLNKKFHILNLIKVSSIEKYRIINLTILKLKATSSIIKLL